MFDDLGDGGCIFSHFFILTILIGIGICSAVAYFID